MITLKRDNVVKVVADDNDAAKLKAKGFFEKSRTEEKDNRLSSDQEVKKVTEAIEKKLTDKIDAVEKVAREAKTVAEDAKATTDAVPAEQPKTEEAATPAPKKTTKK